MRILIIGCGYAGKQLGGVLTAAGHIVFGLRRTKADHSELRARGIQPLHGDIMNSATLRRLPSGFDVVINLVSSSKGGLEDYRNVYLEGTRNILQWLSDSPCRYIYTSSTSVYAQMDGSWVNEESATEP